MSFLLFAIISATLNFLIRPVQSLSTDPSVVGNRSDTSTTNLSATGDVLCSYRYYGSDLDYESYFNAWSKIPRPLSQNSYGTRGQRVDFHIPIRYQSNDGHCVIDIRPTLRGVAVRGDIARGIDISDAAMRVLDSCVTATIGGSVDGFSTYDQLKLAVSKYESKASCNLFPRKIPSIASCGIALAQMPAWLGFEQFLGQMDPPTRGTYNRLPKEYTHQSGPGQSCEILVSKVPEVGSVSGRWFDIWAAGVDIWTMCVQNSMSGIVTDLGSDRRIQIEISDDPAADA